MRLVNIGFGNAVSARRVLAVVSPESAPIKRLGQEARERGLLIDASFGRKTKAVLVMDTGHIVWSSLTSEQIGARFEQDRERETGIGDEEG